MKSKLYKKKVIVLIGGPTASGKSKLAINIAKEINGEIINADSMQVYKNFPILTSQPTTEEKKNVRHYLYGYYDTNKSYNGAIWLKDCYYFIKKSLALGKIPIVVGGTGLYLEFLSKGISKIPKISEKTKLMINDLLLSDGLKSLYKKLVKVDPEYANKISLNDKTRILRALEVFYETKRNISFYHKKTSSIKNFDYYKIFLSPPKEEITKNCIKRFDKMISKGLLEEFEENQKYVKNCNISNAIGFRELQDYFTYEKSLAKLADHIILNTKKYAKRQFTWFNKRYKPQLKVSSYKKKSLILESLSKII